MAHDGTKVAADAGRGSFRGEARIERPLAAARSRVEAMGDPHDETITARQSAARERAGRERAARLEQALVAVRRIAAAKRPSRTKAGFQQTGASTTDPEARIMRAALGHQGLSCTLQLSP